MIPTASEFGNALISFIGEILIAIGIAVAIGVIIWLYFKK
jgi:hypothetical protein